MHWSFPWMVATAGLGVGTYIADLLTRPYAEEKDRARRRARGLVSRFVRGAGASCASDALLLAGLVGRGSRLSPSRPTLIAFALCAALSLLRTLPEPKACATRLAEAISPCTGASVERVVHGWSQQVRVYSVETAASPEAVLEEHLARDPELGSTRRSSRPSGGWALAIETPEREIHIEARRRSDGGSRLRYRVQSREFADRAQAWSARVARQPSVH